MFHLEVKLPDKYPTPKYIVEDLKGSKCQLAKRIYLQNMDK